MATLHTTDPHALRYLLSETLYTASNGQGESSVDLPDGLDGPPDQNDVIKEHEFVCLGQNKKRFLFVTTNTEHPYMSPPALEAFEKTILALGLHLEDIALWNRAKAGEYGGYGAVKEYFKPLKVVFLGKEALPSDLGQVPMDTITDWEGCKMLYSHSFEEMLVSKEKKIAFWKLIKSL